MPDLMIQKIRDYFSTQPAVEKAWLFGSYARGEQTPQSDVDVLVKYANENQISLLDICRLSSGLEQSISRKVDLVEDGCLLPFAVKSVNRDRKLIYERNC